jgi:DNA-directed RNA polymerase subunit RPC12/RpoP
MTMTVLSDLHCPKCGVKYHLLPGMEAPDQLECANCRSVVSLKLAVKRDPRVHKPAPRVQQPSPNKVMDPE